MSKKMPASQQVIEAIKNSGTSCHAISKATGISKATLSRMMNGKVGGWTSRDSFDRLMAYLDLEIVTRKGKR